MVTAAIAGIASAVPPPAGQRALWDEVFSERFAEAPRAQAIWRAVGVRTRGRVADPRTEDLSNWGTGSRMERFVHEATPLGKEAITQVLSSANLHPTEIDHLTVVSCTGYATPGLDVILARDLGMRPDTERLHVGHMGCHAALPAIAVAADAARARGRTSVVLCVELPSLHVQPPTEDPEQVLVHALFGDAAAACVVTPGAGATVVDHVTRTDPEHAELMTWDVTDHGFRMGLAPEVPDVLRKHLRPVVEGLLHRNGLGIGDVARWAVHPGGPRILDVVGEELALDAGALSVSRDVLRTHGNTSSASVLLITERLLASDVGGPTVAMAFGPGLTLAATLLELPA